MADNDQFSFLYRSPPRGNSVTQFIRQQLKPDLMVHGHLFEIRFHDLRATFGMNLLENKLPIEAVGYGGIMNNPEIFQLLMYVRERMGHSQISTTELYLKYRQRYNLALGVQDEYEAHLESLVELLEVDDVLD
ncbi:MAG TPA: site-specific integrase [Gammaproteobacteria bacterium]|nr:site-specific integrase [Gammaproteobacteria bacterium]